MRRPNASQGPLKRRPRGRPQRRRLALGSASALVALALAQSTGATADVSGRQVGPPGGLAERAGEHAVEAIHVFSPTLAWVVGLHGGGIRKPTFRVWNGSTWTKQTHLAQRPPGIRDIDALTPDDAWMVGVIHAAGQPVSEALAAHWNGSAWKITHTPDPIHRGLDAVNAYASDDVWAVGLRDVGIHDKTLAEHWDGERWTVFPTPNFPDDPYNNLLDVVDFGPNDAWALGQTFSSERSSFTEHWDGQHWTFVPLPNPRDLIDGIGGSGPNDLWAVGSSTSGTETYHWDGVQWIAVPCPDPPGRSGELHAITAVASDDVWAVGESYYQDPIATLTEHWDGSHWSIVDSPSPGLHINRLADVDGAAPDDVWAVGIKAVSDDYSAKVLYLHWDGSSWTAVRAQQQH